MERAPDVWHQTQILQKECQEQTINILLLHFDYASFASFWRTGDQGAELENQFTHADERFL